MGWDGIESDVSDGIGRDVNDDMKVMCDGMG